MHYFLICLLSCQHSPLFPLFLCQSFSFHVFFSPFSSAVDCGRPTFPANGRAVFSSTIFSSVTEYECSEGYETTSTTLRATCQMTCRDRVVDRGFCKSTRPFWSENPPACTGNCFKKYLIVSFFFQRLTNDFSSVE